ncbi:uncharacterized protein LOC110692634 [Chenopodium quinoa]|uniref:uncharacterized protein LOC110692634 n=1 Tax=Chenopodium quinoa TaxID=63459 RepID=UPI000B7899AC|nr:uncharacterized protein LOC110692634 [Chenopodium quinoa]
MTDSNSCPWCPTDRESMSHAIFFCNAVKDLWRELDCEALVPDDPSEIFADTLVRWQKMDSKKCLKGYALLRFIWSRRNNKIFNEKEVPHLAIKERVLRIIDDCNKYLTKIYGGVSISKKRSPRIWSPPPIGFIKINCDACLRDKGWVGVGYVAQVLFDGTQRTRGSWPPEIAECKAILFGLKQAQRYGVKNLVVESDSQVVINRLSKSVIYFSDLKFVLDDVMFVNKDFDYVSWSHVRRDGNSVSYHLARLVPFGFEQIWENHSPP